MELFDTLVNAVVLAAVGLILAAVQRGTKKELASLRADVASLRGELKEDLRDVRREIGEVRSDLTRVALAVGAQPRAAGE